MLDRLPNPILESQLAGQITFAHHYHKLHYAVLLDAVELFQEGLVSLAVRVDPDWREAKDWLLDTSSDGPMSLATVCQQFRLCGISLHEDLVAAWAKRHLAAAPKFGRVSRAAIVDLKHWRARSPQ